MRDGVHNWESVCLGGTRVEYGPGGSKYVSPKIGECEGYRVRDLRDRVDRVVIDQKKRGTEGFTESVSKMGAGSVAPGPEELRRLGIKRGVRWDEL
jgi:hypothetical protein